MGRPRSPTPLLSTLARALVFALGVSVPGGAADGRVVLAPAELATMGALTCANTSPAPLALTLASGAPVVDDARGECTFTGDGFVCRIAGTPVALCREDRHARVDERPRLFVLDIEASAGDDEDQAALRRLATSVVTTRLAAAGRFAVTSAGDVRALLEREGTRALLTDAAPALDDPLRALLAARDDERVVRGTLTNEGGLTHVDLVLLDVERARAVARVRASGRDAMDLLRQLAPAVDALVAERAPDEAIAELARRVDDPSALIGALVTGASAAASVGLCGVWPVALAITGRQAGAPEDLAVVGTYCCGCTSGCAVPATVAALLLVDLALDVPPGLARSSLVALTTAAALVVSPTLPVAGVFATVLAFSLAMPGASSDTLAAAAEPFMVLAFAAGLLSAPLVFFAAGFVGYEAGVALFDEGPTGIGRDDDDDGAATGAPEAR